MKINTFAFRHPLAYLRWRLSPTTTPLTPILEGDKRYLSWDEVPSRLRGALAYAPVAGVDDVHVDPEGSDSNVLVSVIGTDEKSVHGFYGDDTCIRMVSPQDFGITAPRQLEAVAAGSGLGWGNANDAQRRLSLNPTVTAVLATLAAQGGVSAITTAAEAELLLRVLEAAAGDKAENILAAVVRGSAAAARSRDHGDDVVRSVVAEVIAGLMETAEVRDVVATKTTSAQVVLKS